MYVEDYGRCFAWFDTGTQDILMAAWQFLHVIKERRGGNFLWFLSSADCMARKQFSTIIIKPLMILKTKS